MTDNHSKVSFIPKSSFVRDESFMERSRPRSAIGFLAVLFFVVGVGSYSGLYFYDASIVKDFEKEAGRIAIAQNAFSKSTEIRDAKLFRSRAEVAKELLDSHVVLSPIFDFLGQNTLDSIMYNSFLYKKDGALHVVELAGEAPRYASLAYQADTLRKKNKELASFSISNITLTSFGTVNFTLRLIFLPDYLSYATVVASTGQNTSVVVLTTETSFTAATSATIIFGTTTVPFVAKTGFVLNTATSTATVSSVKIEGTRSSALSKVMASTQKSFWTWFKFW